MLVSDALNQLSIGLGFRSDLAVRGPQQLARAQEMFEKGPDYPWFLLSEESEIMTSIGERRIPLPTDFLAEYEEGALYYDDETGDKIELVKHDLDYLNRIYDTTATGAPEAYSLDGQYFRIFPLPDLRYQLKMLYYKKDVDPSLISTGATNQWLTYAPECLIGAAGKVLASGLRDNVAIAFFDSMEAKGRALLNNQNEQRKHANRSYQVGGSH